MTNGLTTPTSSGPHSHAAARSALRRIAYSRSDSLSRRRSAMKLTDCHLRLDHSNSRLSRADGAAAWGVITRLLAGVRHRLGRRLH